MESEAQAAEPKAAAAPSSSSDSPSAKPASASYSTDPALYIYTSLTAGSSHIVTATSRLETILRANKVPFKAIDIATDEKARMLWGRRAGKDQSGRLRKLPGLVQMGLVLGDLVEIEEWNEYGELKQHVTLFWDDFTQPPISQKPKTVKKKKVAAAAAPAPVPEAPPQPAAEEGKSKENEKKEPQAAEAAPKPAPAAAAAALPIRSIAEEAAAKAKQVRLQSLRDKVYGKGNTGPPEKKEESTAAAEKGGDGADDSKPAEETAGGDDGSKHGKKPASISLPPPPASPKIEGLQSPNSGAWGGGGGGGPLGATAAAGHAHHVSRSAVQSPTSTSWRFETPTDVDPPVTSLRGAPVRRASQEEIAQIEREQAIPEEVEEEDEEDEEREDDDERRKGEDDEDGEGKAQE